MPPQNPPQSMYPTQPNVPPFGPGLPPTQPQKSHVSIVLVIALIFFIIMFIAAAAFGLWAYAQRNDYKDHTQQKINAALEVSKASITKQVEAEYLEREKSPYREYKGPAQFGAIDIFYPKTWSAAVSEIATSRTPVDGYFHPDFVPDPKSGTGFALRLEVIQQTYDRVLSTYESSAKKGTIRISPYSPPKVPGVLGVRIDGEIIKGYKGSSVVLPLRDKTIRMSTLSPEFVGDFDNIILPNFSFVP